MGSKAREGAKAMSLAFVLLDFQQCGCQNVLDSPFVQKNTTHPLQRGIAGSSEKQEKQLQLLKGNSERGEKEEEKNAGL